MYNNDISTEMANLPGYVLDNLIDGIIKREGNTAVPKKQKSLADFIIRHFIENRLDFEDIDYEGRIRRLKKEQLKVIAKGIKGHEKIPEELLSCLRPDFAKLYFFAGLADDQRNNYLFSGKDYKESLRKLGIYGIASYFILKGIENIKEENEKIKDKARNHIIIYQAKEIRQRYLNEKEIKELLFY